MCRFGCCSLSSGRCLLFVSHWRRDFGGLPARDLDCFAVESLKLAPLAHDTESAAATIAIIIVAIIWLFCCKSEYT